MPKKGILYSVVFIITSLSGGDCWQKKTTLSERTIRNELNFLETKGLVEVSRSGTVITRTGQEFLNELDKYIKELKGLKNLEEEVKKVLGLKQVLLVPGGLEYSTIKQEIGRFTAKYLKGLLKDDDILAVTGGNNPGPGC